MNFGDNLKNIRKANKISQEILAEKLGVSRQSISKWETGENYPTMNNIICLCDIFKCTINELVHEDMNDINLLDDEIKMSVVKFKQNEQKKMKWISKAIYIIARISKFIGVITIIFLTLLMLLNIVILPKTKIDTNNKTIEILNKKYKYKMTKDKIEIKDIELYIDISQIEPSEVNRILSSNKVYLFGLSTLLITYLLLFSICFYQMLKFIERLFLNIYNQDTPFNLENVKYIKKIALYNGMMVITPDIIGVIVDTIFKVTLNIGSDITNYLYVLIIISLAYIFKYGYEIQLDSKGKMYGEYKE